MACLNSSGAPSRYGKAPTSLCVWGGADSRHNREDRDV